MTGKLRRKFVAVAMLSITLVTIFIFGFIAIDMKLRSNAELDYLLEYIASNNGTMPEYNSDSGGRDYITRESRFSTRYFTAVLNENNNVYTTNLENIVSVDNDKAVQMALDVINTKKNNGYLEKYRYLVVDTENGIMVIFLDATVQLRNYSEFIEKAMWIIIAGLIITFFITTLLSKKATAPVIESIEKQKQFVTNAGHDLKTPVAVILADAEVLEMKLGEDDEWVNSIKKQAKRLDTLIKSLLNLARVDENIKKRPEYTEFAIDELMQEEVDAMKVLAKNKTIIYERPKEKINITSDKTGISQLFTILLDNAIKYTPENGKINITIQKQKQNVKVKISNPYTGSNINSNKLFDRFYRGDKSRNAKQEGYGIGLSMAKSIVEANKGKISCNIENEIINFIVVL